MVLGSIGEDRWRYQDIFRKSFHGNHRNRYTSCEIYTQKKTSKVRACIFLFSKGINSQTWTGVYYSHSLRTRLIVSRMWYNLGGIARLNTFSAMPALHLEMLMSLHGRKRIKSFSHEVHIYRSILSIIYLTLGFSLSRTILSICLFFCVL